jgi:hypothetical protein
LQNKSYDNLADLFTKSLSYSTFCKCVEGIGVRRLRDLQESGGESLYTITCFKHHIVLFSLYEFYTYGVFSCKVFNEVMLTHSKYHIIYFSLQGFFEDNIYDILIFDQTVFRLSLGHL